MKDVRIDRNSKRAGVAIRRNDPPRHKRLPPPRPADLKVITNPINPLAAPPLVDPTTKVVNLIPRPISRPRLYRILSTEGMARLEVARHRDRFPDLLRWGHNRLCDANRPLEIRIRIFPGVHNA